MIKKQASTLIKWSGKRSKYSWDAYYLIVSEVKIMCDFLLLFWVAKIIDIIGLLLIQIKLIVRYEYSF